MQRQHARPHVAMIVGNDVTTDTRVKKTAASLRRHGYRVTVLGLSFTGSRTETAMGDVTIVRLPVEFILRNSRRTSHNPLSLPRLAYGSKQDYVVAKRRVKVAERELQAYIGRQKARLGQLQKAGNQPLVAKLERRRIRTAIRARRKVVRVRRQIVERREEHWRRSSQHADLDEPRLLRSAIFRLRTTSPVGASWRRLLPGLQDCELSFGAELDRLEPDVIHAHDFRMIGIAERAAARARSRGRETHWIYDAHELVPGLAQYSPRVLAAYASLEREYISHADRVITVSEPIADELWRNFSLSRRPAVVMNTPLPRAARDLSCPSVRHAAGLDDEVPLLVYSGAADPARGVHTLVKALALVPNVHVALVVKTASSYVQFLRSIAESTACEDRLHIVPFVAPHEVVAYLASATAAVHPLTHYGNHEVALPNKLFEYMHARLPVIVSDVEAMSQLVRQLGIGEVFAAENPASLAEAAARVLAHPATYRHALESDPAILREYSWPAQEPILLSVYRDLLGERVPFAEPVGIITSLAETKPGSTEQRPYKPWQPSASL